MYKDDPFPGQPIDYNNQSNKYENGEFEEFVENMRRELDKIT